MGKLESVLRPKVRAQRKLRLRAERLASSIPHTYLSHRSPSLNRCITHPALDTGFEGI